MQCFWCSLHCLAASTSACQSSSGTVKSSGSHILRRLSRSASNSTMFEPRQQAITAGRHASMPRRIWCPGRLGCVDSYVGV
ncbi:unnamed protein product [Calypogeia fissa]